MRVGATPRLVVLLLVLAPSAVRAQGDDDAYRALIDEAVTEFDAGRFPEARALFLRAHERFPNARTLRGIGMASFEMRDYVEAYRALASALTASERALTAEQRGSVEALLSRTAGFLGLVRVELAPPGVELTVDGAAPAVAPDGRLLLTMGEHEIVASADGYRDSRTRLRIRGGEDEELAISLDAIETAEPRPPAPPPAPADVAPRDRTAAFVVLTVGGAAAAGSIALGLAAWLTREDQLATCESPPPGFACDNLGALRTERDVAATFTIGLALAGAGSLALGAVLLADAESSSRALACAPAGVGLACAGRF